MIFGPEQLKEHINKRNERISQKQKTKKARISKLEI